MIGWKGVVGNRQQDAIDARCDAMRLRRGVLAPNTPPECCRCIIAPQRENGGDRGYAGRRCFGLRDITGCWWCWTTTGKAWHRHLLLAVLKFPPTRPSPPPCKSNREQRRPDRQDGFSIASPRYVICLFYFSSTSACTDPLSRPPELIDKCIGSRIWVIMKGDKGTSPSPSSAPSLHPQQLTTPPPSQNSPEPSWASTTT